MHAESGDSSTVLRVEDLRLQFRVGHDRIRAVDGVSLTLHRGETLGIVGESGSGKSTLGYALLGLLPDNAEISSGSALVGGTDMTGSDPDVLRKARWTRIAMVFQNAMTALNPVISVGDQLVTAMRHHLGLSPDEARARAGVLLERVGVPTQKLMAYPHELSGGQRQRLMIALAVSCEPDVLVADEPTTALDVVAQAQVLGLLSELHRELGIAIILISHDLGAVSSLCDRIAVMYAGQIVELGDRDRILHRSEHPYTSALLRAYPRLDHPQDSLATIPGDPPDLAAPPAGCRFHPRCGYAVARCKSVAPEPIRVGNAGWSRCHFAGQLDFSRSWIGDQ